MREPFRHRVCDGLFDAAVVADAVRLWPPHDWPHWVRYDSGDQSKVSFNNPFWMPAPTLALLRQLLAFPCGELLGLGPLIPDPSLHGAGMHAMRAGDHVRPHIDCTGHPLMPWVRRANAVLYLDACCGGRLVLGDQCVDPRPGRLVLFESTDDSVHAVTPVESGIRRSLSAFFWSHGTQGSRPRARFV